ncbi:hypothetical protein KKE74_02185 [Patescibacteria group bacterium]|nr:hypothetical protein [Patescibacteria group bacterium]
MKPSKPKKKTRKKKINFPTKAILNYIKETSLSLLDFSIDIVINPEKIINDAGFYAKYPSAGSMVSKWVSNLETGTSFERKEGKIYLTEKGRIKIIKGIIKDKCDDIKWDGKWRAIIFDIPEASKLERKFLRIELEYMGFRLLQKSIWIYPYDIEKELTALLKLWKIDFKGDIRFLEINKIKDDKDIKKYFKI